MPPLQQRRARLLRVQYRGADEVLALRHVVALLQRRLVQVARRVGVAGAGLGDELHGVVRTSGVVRERLAGGVGAGGMGELGLDGGGGRRSSCVDVLVLKYVLLFKTLDGWVLGRREGGTYATPRCRPRRGDWLGRR